MTKTIKAFALHEIHRKPDGAKKVEVIPASTKTKISVFETTETEFDVLSERGAARHATKEEIAIHEAAQRGRSVSAGIEPEPEKSEAGNQNAGSQEGKAQDAPVSTAQSAKNDPLAAPKGRRAKAEDDDI